MHFEGYTGGVPLEMRDGMIFMGDIGHFDEDGLLYVDGRADEMIVSGGENVFPSEAEDVIARLPQVREVAVTGVPDPEYGERLAAYIVTAPGERLDADTVRGYVRDRTGPLRRPARRPLPHRPAPQRDGQGHAPPTGRHHRPRRRRGRASAVTTYVHRLLSPARATRRAPPARPAGRRASGCEGGPHLLMAG